LHLINYQLLIKINQKNLARLIAFSITVVSMTTIGIAAANMTVIDIAIIRMTVIGTTVISIRHCKDSDIMMIS